MIQKSVVRVILLYMLRYLTQQLNEKLKCCFNLEKKQTYCSDKKMLFLYSDIKSTGTNVSESLYAEAE